MKIKNNINNLLKDPKIKKALEYVVESDEETSQIQIEMCEIESPSHGEKEKGLHFKSIIEDYGLTDISVDEVGNVIGYIKGVGDGPKLLLCAHLDTVFPFGTDVKVKREGNNLKAPGISDNCRGLAEILTISRAIKKTGIELVGDLMIVADVCEEALGDLLGVKTLLKNHKDINGFMTIDGPGMDKVRCSATGGIRYKAIFKGPGGHSFKAFGTPSAVHAMGRAISLISELEVKNSPKTTYNVGVASGGSGVSAIAQNAIIDVDIRSNDENELKDLTKRIIECIENAVAFENKRNNSDDLKVELELLGKRPAGELSVDLPIVRASMEVTQIMGFEAKIYPPASTDANIPIGLGIPTVQVGFGGDATGVHSLDEVYYGEGSIQGLQKNLVMALALVGVKDTCEPLML